MLKDAMLGGGPYITKNLCVVVLNNGTADEVISRWEINDGRVDGARATIGTTSPSIGDGKVNSH